MKNWRLLLLITWISIFALSSKAIITIGSGDPHNNTSPPKSARQVWDQMIQFEEYIGTPIASRFFLEATHVGRNTDEVSLLGGHVRVKPLHSDNNPKIGKTFRHAGNTYKIVAEYHNPNKKDFTIYEVDKDFPSWVSLNTNTNEIGMKFLDFGCGLRRGDEVWDTGYQPMYTTIVIDLRDVASANDQPVGLVRKIFSSMPDTTILGHEATIVQEQTILTNVLKGWTFGLWDGVARWGQNEVSEVISFGDYEFIIATFDDGTGPDECYIAFGDSGGPCITEIDGRWTLIGINYGIDVAPATDQNGPFFYGALFDTSGMWIGNNQIPFSTSRPMRFYISRISTQIDWILSIINTP